MSLTELPKGWVWTKLADVSFINPRFNGEKITDDIDVSFLPMRAVQERSGKIDLSLTKKLSEVKKGYTAFIEGDLLFAKITPCMENGKIAIAKNLHNGIGFGSTEFHVIRINPSLSSKFFFFFLIQDYLREDARRNMKGTAGQLRVPPIYMEQISIPLPPIPEQNRIVAKIEELFSDLEAGVEALKKAKAQLRLYRQAVLKAAFEGRLTTAWREVHRGELEPASILLERINRGKQKTSRPINLSELPDLPKNWAWARIIEIGEVVTGTTPKKATIEYYGREYPFYKPTDLNAGYFVRESDDGLSDEGIKKARLLPAKSILVTCIGATIGKSGFIRVPGSSNQQINAIISKEGNYPEFIYFMTISPYFQKSIIDNASATTLLIINKSKFEMLLIPVSPFDEQKRIVEGIEFCFSLADEAEKAIDQGIKQSERLRQSILKQAFSGRLVPQNPEDEPAAELLERIKREKAGHAAGKKPGRRAAQRKLNYD